MQEIQWGVVDENVVEIFAFQGFHPAVQESDKKRKEKALNDFYLPTKASLSTYLEYTRLVDYTIS